jgi:endonuclease/exonuclease/phosphatase family metal-dependent hydrolase
MIHSQSFWLYAILALVLIVTLYFLSTELWKPAPQAVQVLAAKNIAAGQPGGRIRVVTWNLGYAGLGHESDFRADGGKMLRVPSRAAALENSRRISEKIAAFDADVILLQEMAGRSPFNRGVDMRAHVRKTIEGGWFAYSREIEPRWAPGPIRPRHGKAVLSRYLPVISELNSLSGDGETFFGLLARNYNIQTLVYGDPDGVPWALLNIHLAAFDEGGKARFRQLSEVLEVGEALYQRGYHVVIGGDWNLRLTQTEFPSTTQEEYLFWIHDFPKELLPDGWRLTFDPGTPTVRTNERPYKRGENYTTIIDGFLLSPNVSAISAHTEDLDFQNSDHQPVTVELEAIH